MIPETLWQCLSSDYSSFKKSIAMRFRANAPELAVCAAGLQHRKDLLVFMRSNSKLANWQQISGVILSAFAFNDNRVLGAVARQFPSSVRIAEDVRFQCILYNALMSVARDRQLVPALLDTASNTLDGVDGAVVAALTANANNDPDEFGRALTRCAKSLRASRTTPIEYRLVGIQLHGCYRIGARCDWSGINTWDAEHSPPVGLSHSQADESGSKF